MTKPSCDEIDALLPQTQCGLCGYPACRPYATAIANDNERIDKCPPGGVKTLQALARLLQKDATPLMAEMMAKEKPQMIAKIREDECIGCTKCIQACPVDAIIGANKKMHSVITAECTGCELCVPPCPVDCIDMVVIAKPSTKLQVAKANLARERYQHRSIRLAKAKQQKELRHKQAKLDTSAAKENIISARKLAIDEAIARAKAKNKPHES